MQKIFISYRIASLIGLRQDTDVTDWEYAWNKI